MHLNQNRIVLVLYFTSKYDFLGLLSSVRVKIHFSIRAQSFIVDKSWFMSSEERFMSWTKENCGMSSAISFGFVVRFFGRSKKVMPCNRNSRYSCLQYPDWIFPGEFSGENLVHKIPPSIIVFLKTYIWWISCKKS